MMTVYLQLKETPVIPIEAEVITPRHFVEVGEREIGSLDVHQGNRTLPLRQFFRIEGETGPSAEETEIVVRGDSGKVKMIGKGMDGGRIRVEGDAGMYLGAEMSAGRIHVLGSVGAWAGAEMKGGNVQIEGNAGEYLCSAYRGSRDGMQGGRVFVAGNVGDEVAYRMRRGLISVKGNVGMHAASRMTGGTMIVLGNVSPRTGFEATGGMVIVSGTLENILPTFSYSGTSEREFVYYYLRYLMTRRPDFKVQGAGPQDRWAKFVGDFSEGHPRQELYVRESCNVDLISRRGPHV